MAKKVNFILALFCAIVCLTFAQNNDFNSKGSRIILSTKKISNVKYFVYEPTFKVQAIYRNKNQVTNDSPEKLMSSILSANNQEWEDLNTLGGSLKSEKLSKEDIIERSNINSNTTYFELLSKLEFVANNSNMAIIKFNIHDKRLKKPAAGVTVMQQENGMWKKTSTPYLSNISMAVLVFKVDVLGRLLEGKSNNEHEKNIIEKYYDKEGLNFNELIKLELNETEKEQLTNPLNW